MQTNQSSMATTKEESASSNKKRSREHAKNANGSNKKVTFCVNVSAYGTTTMSTTARPTTEITRKEPTNNELQLCYYFPPCYLPPQLRRPGFCHYFQMIHHANAPVTPTVLAFAVSPNHNRASSPTTLFATRKSFDATKKESRLNATAGPPRQSSLFLLPAEDAKTRGKEATKEASLRPNTSANGKEPSPNESVTPSMLDGMTNSKENASVTPSMLDGRTNSKENAPINRPRDDSKEGPIVDALVAKEKTSNYPSRDSSCAKTNAGTTGRDVDTLAGKENGANQRHHGDSFVANKNDETSGLDKTLKIPTPATNQHVSKIKEGKLPGPERGGAPSPQSSRLPRNKHSQVSSIPW